MNGFELVQSGVWQYRYAHYLLNGIFETFEAFLGTYYDFYYAGFFSTKIPSKIPLSGICYNTSPIKVKQVTKEPFKYIGHSYHFL